MPDPTVKLLEVSTLLSHKLVSRFKVSKPPSFREFPWRSPVGAPVIGLKRPSASVRAAFARGVRRPDANAPTPHFDGPPPTLPTPALLAATNSFHGACNDPKPPSR